MERRSQPRFKLPDLQIDALECAPRTEDWRNLGGSLLLSMDARDPFGRAAVRVYVPVSRPGVRYEEVVL